MGSWNATCSLSNLPIEPGTDVWLAVLEQSPGQDRCYSTALWRPVPLLARAVYADYGECTDHDTGFELVLNGIRKSLVELSQGENEYHDIAVTADKFDATLFWDAVHEQRLKVTNILDQQVSVDVALIRADIVEELEANSKQTLLYKNSSGKFVDISYTWTDIVEAVPEFLNRIRSVLLTDDFSAVPTDTQIGRIKRGILGLYDPEEGNLIAWYLRYQMHSGFSGVLCPITEFVRLLLVNDDIATSVLLGMIRLSWLDILMSQTRRQWLPGGFAGSQSAATTQYWVLLEAVRKVLTNMDAND